MGVLFSFLIYTLKCRLVSPLLAAQTLKAAKLWPSNDKNCYQFITIA